MSAASLAGKAQVVNDRVHPRDVHAAQLVLADQCGESIDVPGTQAERRCREPGVEQSAVGGVRRHAVPGGTRRSWRRLFAHAG